MLEKLFLSRRIYSELKAQRIALERIAFCLERLLVGQGKGTSLTSFKSDREDLNEGEVLNMTDEDFAQLEALEEERRMAGGEVGMDEDLLKGDYR